MASLLQQARHAYEPRLPGILKDELAEIALTIGEAPPQPDEIEKIAEFFPRTVGRPLLRLQSTRNGFQPRPRRVGVLLSGGPAPGGHNVILGLFDGLKRLHPESALVGFLGGPDGLLKAQYNLLTDEVIRAYRNTGGFDMVRSGRTKVETPEQFASALKTCIELELDALVVIGGDDSNTNAANIAEYFLQHAKGIQVIGVPKTIDGDLKGPYVDASFGFDSACKVYAELVGNICRDAMSAGKYWHFIKLMGRSASHVTLEVALETHVNVAILGEEVAAENKTLRQVVDEIADVVELRHEAGKSYGVVLVSEGLLEFIPEMGTLIRALNGMFGAHGEGLGAMPVEERVAFVSKHLKPENRDLFESLPKWLQMQLIADPDPHGNLKVSQIETDRLLVEMVERDLETRKARGTFSGKFDAQRHFFGYEGRCVQPSNFDADYTYGLGIVAAILISGGATGYMAVLRDLHLPHDQWIPVGVPLTSLMNMEQRRGKDVPVIRKALVDLKGEPFQYFKNHRSTWATQDSYKFPGPIQYFGPPEVCDQMTETLRLEKGVGRTRSGG